VLFLLEYFYAFYIYPKKDFSLNVERYHEFNWYGYKAKSVPGLIHSANQFIKFPYIIVQTVIVNKYMGLQSIYLAPTTVGLDGWWGGTRLDG
jgi:hypothetical protein